MKCTECGLEKPTSEFRYLYNPQIDTSISLRQCPKCRVSLSVDELKGQALGVVTPGDEVWGKSTGIGH